MPVVNLSYIDCCIRLTEVYGLKKHLAALIGNWSCHKHRSRSSYLGRPSLSMISDKSAAASRLQPIHGPGRSAQPRKPLVKTRTTKGYGGI